MTLPVGEDASGQRAAGLLVMLGDEILELRLILRGGDPVGADELVVVAAEELVLQIEDEGLAAGHASAEILARGSEDHDGATGHVFATMVADSLDDGGAARVADTEALAGAAVGKEMPRDGPVHHGVADDAVLFGNEAVIGERADNDLAAAHALADIVVPLAGEDEADTRRQEGAKALSGGAGEIKFESPLGKTLLAVLVGDLSGDLGGHGAVGVVDLVGELHGLGVADRLLGILKNDVVERLIVLGIVAVTRGVTDGRRVILHDILEEAREVDGVRLRVIGDVLLAEALGAADHLVDGAEAEARHDLADFLGDRVEEVDDILWLPLELAAETLVDRGDADRAVVEMALADIDAAHRDEGRGSEVVFLGAEQRGVDDVLAGTHAAVGTEGHAVAETVEQEHLMGLGDAEFPRAARVFHGAERGGAGAAVMTADQNDVGVGFGHTGGHGSDAGLGDELHSDACAGIDLLEIVDQLREILDRVDVVVRRGRDEGDAGDGVAELRDVDADLVAGELSSLAGLGALGHLDLDLLGARQIGGMDAETAGSDLLDGAVGPVAVLIALEAARILAAFTAVRLAADAVHGDGEGLVGLGAERTQRHAGRGEAAADLLDRLDLVDRHGTGGTGDELEQVARGMRGRCQDGVDVGLVVLGLVGADEAVEVLDDRRGDGVKLAAAADAVEAGVAELKRGGFLPFLDWQRGGVGHLVTSEGLAGDLLEADTLDLRRGAGEALLDQFGRDAGSLEDLGAAVAADDGDSHLGHDLEQAALERLLVVELGGGEVDLDRALLDHLADGLDGQVGVDRASAITDEAGHLVHITRLAGLADEADAHALAGAAKVMVHGSDGEHRGDGEVVGIDSLVAEHKDAGSLVDGRLDGLAEFLHGGGKPGVSGSGLPECGDGGGLVLATDPTDGRQLLVEEDRRVDRDLRGVLGGLGEEVAPPAERGEERHHQALADRVDRRVGDLGKELAEVGVEQAGTKREHRERRVVAHRADGLGTILDHRLEDHVELLARVAEGDLTLGQVDDVEVTLGGLELLRLERGDADEMVVHHLAVVVAGGEICLDLGVAHQNAGGGVDGDHLAGGEAALLDDRILIESIDAHLGAEAEDAVIGDLVAGGAKSVPVEAGADGDAVGEDQGGWAVPRLAEAGMVLVERGKLGRDLLVTAPSRGNQHGHGMEDRAARHGQDLKHVIQARGIGSARLDDRLEQVDVGPPEVGLQLRLAGLGPVAVAADGVDLSVVRHHPEGVGERPGREGVRAVALVIDAERGLVVGMREVGEELLERRGNQQALVDDKAVGEGGDVEALDLVGGGAVLDLVAGEEETALVVVIRHAPRAADEHLLDVGEGHERFGAEDLLVGRNLAPSKETEAALFDHFLGDRLGAGLGILVLVREIHDADTEVGLAVKLVAEFLDDRLEEFVRDLGRDAGSVAGPGIGVQGPSVHQVTDGTETDTEDLVGAVAADSGNHADAAGVFLKSRIIERGTALMVGQGMVHGVSGCVQE